MKIIAKKDSHSPRRWKLRFTCTQCGSDLEGNGNDLRIDHHTGMFYFCCPVCREFHPVTGSIPPFVLQAHEGWGSNPDDRFLEAAVEAINNILSIFLGR